MNGWQGAIDDAREHLELGEADHAAALVRQVLAEHPDAIDAYVVLAQTCVVRAEAIALLREAVFIGNRTGKMNDQPTVPAKCRHDRDAYIRALGNLARLLWADGRVHQRTVALRHARRAFRLDPEHRAGTRLLLMAWEASAGNWPAARRITRQCRDEARTEVRYWLALHAFRDDSTEAEALRARAIAINPHVVAALQGRLLPLNLLQASCRYGSPDEAVFYAFDARDGWASTPGALAWLAAAQV